MTKKEMPSPLANSRIRTMSWQVLENASRAYGIDLRKMDTETMRSKQSEVIDILTKDFREFKIIYPYCQDGLFRSTDVSNLRVEQWCFLIHP